MTLRAQARRRLARELRRLAGTLTRWADDTGTGDAGSGATPGAAEPGASPDPGRDHWLATVRARAPELLAGGGMGYSLDPGPRAWRPGTDRPSLPGARTGTGGPGTAGDAGMPPPGPDPGPDAPPVSPAGVASVSPAAAPPVRSGAHPGARSSRGAPGDGEPAAGAVVAGAGPAPGGAAAPPRRPATRPAAASGEPPVVTSPVPPTPWPVAPRPAASPAPVEVPAAVTSGIATPLGGGEPVLSRAAGALAWPGPVPDPATAPAAPARVSAAVPDLTIPAPAGPPPADRTGPPPWPAATAVPGLAPAGAPGPASPATPAPWPALATDSRRPPAAHARSTERWPALPDDTDQRAWAAGLAHRDAERTRRLEREQRGAR